MNFLLTGGSGKLGKELKKLLPNCIAPTKEELNILYTSTKPYFDYENIDTVVHCAAYTNVPGAEANKKEAILNNIIGTKNISEIFGYYRIVYISTDYVYEGLCGNYKEIDRTNPFNFYGFTKLGGEAFINPEKDLIIRTSFKPNEPWLYKKAFTDLFTSADYVDVIAKKISKLVQSNLTGIINVGTERKSVYDLAIRRNPDVEKMSISEIKNVRLPFDISMNLDRLDDFKRKTEAR